jgi:4-amino-4-deoxychorismate lyase
VDSATAIWLDGRPDAALPLPDRGLDFGDGLFETLLLRDGEPLFPEYHMARLGEGLGRLGFPDCTARARQCLEQACADIASRRWQACALRLMVTRGGGPRGYAPPEHARPRVLVTATRMERDCDTLLPPACLAVSTVRWPTQPLLAGLKHLNRLEQVLASAENRRQGVDESVMLDQDGRVISAVAGNIFIVSEGRLRTPPLNHCGIAGTRRLLVLERWAPAIGLAVEEKELDLADLLAAEEIFITNSLFGLRPVARLDDTGWIRHQTCRALFQRYLEETP